MSRTFVLYGNAIVKDYTHNYAKFFPPSLAVAFLAFRRCFACNTSRLIAWNIWCGRMALVIANINSTYTVPLAGFLPHNFPWLFIRHKRNVQSTIPYIIYTLSSPIYVAVHGAGRNIKKTQCEKTFKLTKTIAHSYSIQTCINVNRTNMKRKK